MLLPKKSKAGRKTMKKMGLAEVLKKNFREDNAARTKAAARAIVSP